MVNSAEETARNAEQTGVNKPGYCLQHCRIWAGVAAQHGTAAVAWAAALRKQYDRNPPRGAFVFWTGGSQGYGHIVISLGGGLVRSTDAGGTGRVATRTIAWFDSNWPSQNYAGWTDNVNGVTVPGVIDTRDGFDMADLADLRKIVQEELAAARAEYADAAQSAVWSRNMTVTNNDGLDVKRNAAQVIRETWEKATKILNRR